MFTTYIRSYNVLALYAIAIESHRDSEQTVSYINAFKPASSNNNSEPHINKLLSHDYKKLAESN